MARRDTSGLQSNEGTPPSARTSSRIAVQFIKRRDLFELFEGSCPTNKNEDLKKRDFVFDNWQQSLRRIQGPIMVAPWPKLAKDNSSKKQGPSLDPWPSKDHDKFSSKHHFSMWLWDALNKCALIQFSPFTAMNHILSFVSTPPTQQQIRGLLRGDKKEPLSCWGPLA